MTDVLLKTQDQELMDEVRDNEKIFVAGIKYHVDGYTITKDPDTGEEVLITKLVRVYPNNVLRCPKDDCNGERIKQQDNRFANGTRWQCNVCNWRQEA